MMCQDEAKKLEVRGRVIEALTRSPIELVQSNPWHRQQLWDRVVVLRMLVDSSSKTIGAVPMGIGLRSVEIWDSTFHGQKVTDGDLLNLRGSKQRKSTREGFLGGLRNFARYFWKSFPCEKSYKKNMKN